MSGAGGQDPRQRDVPAPTGRGGEPEGPPPGEPERDRPGWEQALDDPEEPLYTVGVVADLMGLDAQVVRGYDQRGLVSPSRSASGHRRYSRRDIDRLFRAIRLSEQGIPSAGIERILELEDELQRRDGEAD